MMKKNVHGMEIQQNKCDFFKKIDSLYIINKMGGLIYHRSFTKGLPKLDVNEYIFIGSAFYGISKLANEVAPVPPPLQTQHSGIQMLLTDTFLLHSLQTQTGVRFFVVADPNASHLEQSLKGVYDLYTDCVLKNPFYVNDQPIKSEQFEYGLEKLLSTT